MLLVKDGQSVKSGEQIAQVQQLTDAKVLEQLGMDTEHVPNNLRFGLAYSDLALNQAGH